jgi:hypothetical protein
MKLFLALKFSYLMKIYVDADACPTVIKDILYRVSQRTGIEVILVANQALSTPRIPTVRSIQVSQGFDVADDHIVELVEEAEDKVSRPNTSVSQADHSGN